MVEGAVVVTVVVEGRSTSSSSNRGSSGSSGSSGTQ